MLKRIVKRAAVGGLLALAVGTSVLALVAYQRAELIAPPPTKLLVDRHGRFLGEVGPGDDAPIGYWRLDPVPPRIASAMIAIEDHNFWSHEGVDFEAVARALLQNLRSGRRISGASTIAMQVARMQHPAERSYLNKAIEGMAAILMVRKHGRHRVLAHYLRIAPYSNRIRGIAFASRRYFDKPAVDLSWAEIAFLAAIPQSPTRMNPYRFRGYRRAIGRGKRILALLHRRGVLGEADLELALEQIERLSIPGRAVRPPQAMHAILRLEAEVGQREDIGPMIRTTLDLAMMESLHPILDQAVYGFSARGADNGALVVVDRATSGLLAYFGSADYFDPDHAGAIDFADTPRPSGSTLKPFLYGLALERGQVTPATVVDDLFRARGGVSNADDRFLGPLLLRVALANSRNVPAANLAETIGLPTVYDNFSDLGLHRDERPVDHYGLGVVLGLLPVTLYDLVNAYTALGDGRLRPLTMIADAPRPTRRIMSQATARQLTAFLSDPMARLPTFPRMGDSEYPFPVALKTGTSQAYRDAWTVAFTQRYLIGVWIGRGDAKKMSRLGGIHASRVVREVISALHAPDMNGLADLSFPPPKGHRPVAVCPLSGMRATPSCDRRFVEHLRDVHLDPCTVHVTATVDGQVKTVTDLPPRYRTWATRMGIESTPMMSQAPMAAPQILRPEPGARVLRDPEVPDAQATLALVASASPDTTELVWYVDGRPFRTVGPPFEVRWPLRSGEHVFEARVPFTEKVSSKVSVIVE